MAALRQPADQCVTDEPVAVRAVIGQQFRAMGNEDSEGTTKAHGPPPATLGCRARNLRKTSADRNDTSARRGRSPGRGKSRKREKLTSTKANRAQVESSRE